MASLQPRPAALPIAALCSLVVAACAHGPAATDGAAPGGDVSEAAPVPAIARPESRTEARGMLERAFEASAEGEHQLAVALYGAVLATDYLTDKGRANLYWMRAESFQALGAEAARADALAGFLVASDLPEIDADLTMRRLLAKSLIAAMRVETDPGFGRSPETPISVDDVREPASIIASLSCGPTGRGRYVDVAIRSVLQEDNRLVHRRAECEGDGRVLELWFDVTHASADE